jgi:hypothetical protein
LTFLNFVSLSIVAVPFGRIFPLFFPVVGPAFIEISSRLNDQCDIVGLKRSFHLVALVVARRKHHVITRLVILSFLGVVGAVVNSWTGNYIGKFLEFFLRLAVEGFEFDIPLDDDVFTQFLEIADLIFFHGCQDFVDLVSRQVEQFDAIGTVVGYAIAQLIATAFIVEFTSQFEYIFGFDGEFPASGSVVIWT